MRTDDAYEQMKTRDRAASHATGTEATRLVDARNEAQHALLKSQRLIDRVGGDAHSYVRALDDVKFISAAQEHAAGETAAAALNVAEATKNLQSALQRHEVALAELEGLRTRLDEANVYLEKCLAKSERAREDHELGRIHVGDRAHSAVRTMDGRARPETAEDARRRAESEQRARSHGHR